MVVVPDITVNGKPKKVVDHVTKDVPITTAPPETYKTDQNAGKIE